jgi:broad specificity phosphatase PhoE
MENTREELTSPVHALMVGGRCGHGETVHGAAASLAHVGAGRCMLWSGMAALATGEPMSRAEHDAWLARLSTRMRMAACGGACLVVPCSVLTGVEPDALGGTDAELSFIHLERERALRLALGREASSCIDVVLRRFAAVRAPQPALAQALRALMLGRVAPIGAAGGIGRRWMDGLAWRTPGAPFADWPRVAGLLFSLCFIRRPGDHGRVDLGVGRLVSQPLRKKTMKSISIFARQRICALAIAVLAICPFGAPFAQIAPPLAERIDLIRHGESEDNPDQGQAIARLDGTLQLSRGKVLSGWNAVSLTMRGVAQAVKTGESMRATDKSEAVSMRDALWLYSPLLRTRQTLSGVLLGADLVGQNGVNARPETRLFERSAGELTGLTWDEAARVWPEMKKGRAAAVFTQASAAYPRGESLAIVYRRAVEALDEALATERRVIVVSHELTIKALVAYLTRGTIDDAAFALKVENGKPISLVRRNGKWELVAVAVAQ